MSFQVREVSLAYKAIEWLYVNWTKNTNDKQGE